MSFAEVFGCRLSTWPPGEAAADACHSSAPRLSSVSAYARRRERVTAIKAEASRGTG